MRRRRLRADPAVRVARSFEELVELPLGVDCSAVCWERPLSGDFEGLALACSGDGPIRSLEGLSQSLEGPAPLHAPLGAAVRAALALVQGDLQGLRELGHQPDVECVLRYPEDADDLVPTDVYSFHVDTATVPTETFLCSYTGPASEGLRRDQADRKVDLLQVRRALWDRWGGEGEEAFEEYLRLSHMDLHYQPRRGATPYSFGVGALWKIAVQHPGSSAPALIHRAPRTAEGAPPRLLLIS